MMSDPATWSQLMEKLSHVVGHYLLAQVQARRPGPSAL
jgi:uroporphyrinogen-III decarboxylase